MADLLIKGMEMPETCDQCPCYDNEYGDCNAAGEYIEHTRGVPYKPDWCPLVAVEPVEQFQIDGGTCWKEAR